METWPTLDTPEPVEKYVAKYKSINALTQELQVNIVNSAHWHG
jgi:hypothetical protein